MHASRLEAELQLGRHAAVLGELEEGVRARPLDEARWARLALARYRSGQQVGPPTASSASSTSSCG